MVEMLNDVKILKLEYEIKAIIMRMLKLENELKKIEEEENELRREY